jgi:hypothetical protein
MSESNIPDVSTNPSPDFPEGLSSGQPAPPAPDASSGASAASAPATDTSAAAPAVQPQPAQPQPAQPQPQQPAPPGSLWKNVLEGALRCLAGGGVVGAAVGAVKPDLLNKPAQMRQQTAQANINFTNAQAAHALAQQTMAQHQIDLMDSQLKQRQVTDQEDRAQHLMDTGNSPLVILPDDKPETLQAGLQHVANLNGGKVGELFALRYGNGYAVFDGEKMNNSSAALQDTNLVRSLTGQQEIPLSQWASKTTPAGVKSQWVKQANDILYPTPEAGDKLNGQIATQNSLLETAKALPDDNPNKQRLVDTFTKNVSRLTEAQSGRVSEKYNLAQKELAERGKAFGQYRIVQTIDPDTNELKWQWAKDAVGNTPAQVGMSAEKSHQQLSEMGVASQTLRNVINNMPPLSSGEAANIAYALRSNDNSNILALATTGKVGKEILTPQQQEYVTWVAQMHERAMAMRGAAGIGNQGSDKLRDAIIATLPMPNDTKELMNKKLDAFDQQVRILDAGIPQVHRGGTQNPQNPQNQTPKSTPQTPKTTDPFAQFGGTAHKQPVQ